MSLIYYYQNKTVYLMNQNKDLFYYDLDTERIEKLCRCINEENGL